MSQSLVGAVGSQNLKAWAHLGHCLLVECSGFWVNQWGPGAWQIGVGRLPLPLVGHSRPVLPRLKGVEREPNSSLAMASTLSGPLT